MILFGFCAILLMIELCLFVFKEANSRRFTLQKFTELSEAGSCLDVSQTHVTAGIEESRIKTGCALCTQDTHISCCLATGFPCFISLGLCASCCSLCVTPVIHILPASRIKWRPTTYEERMQKRLMVRDRIQEINRKIPTDLIVYTKAEYELLQRHGISFLNEIEISRKILYEKASESVAGFGSR